MTDPRLSEDVPNNLVWWSGKRQKRTRGGWPVFPALTHKERQFRARKAAGRLTEAGMGTTVPARPRQKPQDGRKGHKS